MLTTLSELHNALVEALAGLAALTERDRPDAGQLARQRLALSRASIARSRFVELEIFPRLLEALPAAEAEPVRRLRSDAAALRVLSAQHVGRWPIDTAMSDWPGYCAASRTMRAAMRQQIGAEQNRLYPLLREPASRRAA